MSATARAATVRPVPSRAATPRPRPTARAPLAVVAGPAPKHGRSVFAALVVGLLALGLASLLALNTVLAQDAFVAQTLERRSAELAVAEQAMAARVAVAEDPAQLADRARALGLREAGAPLFLRLPDGAILGRGPDRGATR